MDNYMTSSIPSAKNIKLVSRKMGINPDVFAPMLYLTLEFPIEPITDDSLNHSVEDIKMALGERLYEILSESTDK